MRLYIVNFAAHKILPLCHFSSFLAHTEKEHSKAKKKERVKEYLKELKSIVQAKGEGRVGTLTTLQHVLSSMRKIKGKLSVYLMTVYLFALVPIYHFINSVPSQ